VSRRTRYLECASDLFEPTAVGKYQINCAQLAATPISAMSAGVLVVESQADFDNGSPNGLPPAPRPPAIWQ